jgi:hypothetical protein
MAADPYLPTGTHCIHTGYPRNPNLNPDSGASKYPLCEIVFDFCVLLVRNYFKKVRKRKFMQILKAFLTPRSETTNSIVYGFFLITVLVF